MSASHIAERGASYALPAAMELAFGATFDLLATAPQGVAKLRELILLLAVRGKLVPQDPDDENAEILLGRLRANKENLAAAGLIKRSKAMVLVSNDEKFFELPDTWAWTRFDTVVNNSEAGWSPSCDGGQRQDGTWGVLKVSAVSWGEFRSYENKQLPAALKPRPEYEVHAGDFLISRANTAELVARSVVAKNPGAKLMLSDKIIRLDISILADREYFNIVNNAQSSRDYYAANASGTSSSMKNVGREVILSMPVPMPPLAEQARIVARVEELMQLCDGLEAHGRLQDKQHARLVATLFDALAASESADALAENWQRIATHFDLLLDRPEAVDALEQTLLQLAVRGLLVPQDPTDEPASELLCRLEEERSRLLATGEIKRDRKLPTIEDDAPLSNLPAGWSLARLGSLANFIDYRGRTPVKTSEGVPLITAKNVRMGHIDRQPHEFIASDQYSSWMTRGIPRIGDLLFTTEAPLGNVAAIDIPGRFALAQRVICFALFEPRMSEFLKYLLMSADMQVEFSRQATGVTAQGIKSARLQLISLPVPPLAEQRRIVARVEQLRRLCANLRERLQQSRTTQSQLAEALVSAAAQSPAC